MSKWRIEVGDCRDVLRQMPARSVHTVVTSPPYFGLRDYGTGEWEGGDPACDHRRGVNRADGSRKDGKPRGTNGFHGTTTDDPGAGPRLYDGECGKCGARRVDRQIGLEPTPDEFVAALVAVFREVRRVLRDDGTVWLNLGDSYAAVNRGENATPRSDPRYELQMQGTHFHSDLPTDRRRIEGQKQSGIKPKDLLGIPWMVAFALRADGWYLRSDIVWSKPNPMPESVTDRPTKAHEYVFLLSKAPRYYFDADAIREPHEAKPQRRLTNGVGKGRAEAVDDGHGLVAGVRDRIRDDVAHDGHPAGRNKRSVWTVATQPFSAKSLGISRRVRVEPGDADGDTKRTTSPDCPVHGDRPAPVATAPDGGHADDAPIRTADNDDRPVLTQPDALAPIGRRLAPDYGDGSSGSPRPFDSQPATPHSTGTRRTADRSGSGGTACEETSLHIESTLPSRGTPAPDGSGSRDSSQNPDRTVHRSTCTCEYYRLEDVDHFATFPLKLIEPCILAGAPGRACGECGAPWVRVVEVESRPNWQGNGGQKHNGTYYRENIGGGVGNDRRTRTDLGFEPSCSHGDGSARGVVLDPFAGAGTTGIVALQHGREFVGVELNPQYAAMARDRIETAVRLGFRSPQRVVVPDGQDALFV